jgi:outer membrane protein assembly factor BamD
MKNFALISLIISLTAITGCSWLGSDVSTESENTNDGYTEREFYEKIQRSLNSQNWSVAINNLQLLESQFPFGKYAEQSQLELIFAQYMSADYDSSILSAERFIRLHPQHPNVDYAFYVKGLCELSQSARLFSGYIPIDESKRDIGSAREAFATFGELLSKFPNSPYAPDARKRLVNLRNQLARSEINVANYYFSRGALVAAANRGQYVVENFQQSPAVADGLAVMAQAYHMMGKQSLADNAVEVLATNYPDYPLLDENNQFEYDSRMLYPSNWFLSKLTMGLIKQSVPPAFDSRAIYNKVAQQDEKAK